MVLASADFRDVEYIVPRAFFEQNNCSVKTASTKDISVGSFGYRVENDFLLGEVETGDFDGLFFVGGAGSLGFMEDDEAKNLAFDFLNSGKPLGAICAAPRNFLKWGVLEGKRATGHNWDGNFPTFCKKFGAEFENNSVVVDEKVLTADGPEAAEETAVEFLKMFE